jgi:hypothetical protein
LSGRPAWSPDGHSLALVCYDQEDHSLGLKVVSVAKGTADAVWDSPLADAAPSWGKGVIYVGRSASETRPYQLMSVPLSGAKPVRATDGSGTETAPDWGAPGLLYIRNPDDNGFGALCLQGPDKPIVLKASDVREPNWSPDYRSIAWLGHLPDDPQTVAVWVATFTTPKSGAPKIGEPTKIEMSGTPGPLAWGSR